MVPSLFKNPRLSDCAPREHAFLFSYGRIVSWCEQQLEPGHRQRPNPPSRPGRAAGWPLEMMNPTQNLKIAQLPRPPNSGGVEPSFVSRRGPESESVRPGQTFVISNPTRNGKICQLPKALRQGELPERRVCSRDTATWKIAAFNRDAATGPVKPSQTQSR
jgi:hypothetical protein